MNTKRTSSQEFTANPVQGERLVLSSDGVSWLSYDLHNEELMGYGHTPEEALDMLNAIRKFERK
jgi:hypothetical protein